MRGVRAVWRVLWRSRQLEADMHMLQEEVQAKQK